MYFMIKLFLESVHSVESVLRGVQGLDINQQNELDKSNSPWDTTAR